VSDVTRTVYGIYYPETRRIVDALWAERPHGDYERNYTGRQDAMHRACLERWRAWAGAAGVVLGSGYDFEYPTAGANEALHALIALHAARGGRRVHVFEGEYEGYSHVAHALGLEVATHARDPDLYARSIPTMARAGDLFFLSQPSAIDGNLWRGFDPFCAGLASMAPGVDLVVDVTYVGAVTTEPRIDLTHAVIRAVVWSLSKPFGVYYHRIGGVVSRPEIPTLRGHHWFKNLFSLRLGERLMAAHGACDLPRRYAPLQAAAVQRCRAAGTLPASARPSDVVMIAYAPSRAMPGDREGVSTSHGTVENERYAEYARGGLLRFCLSAAIDGAIQP
jgi:histidinol-phosphate/aromatic aminotransferase/cobyric acid decarboxylase-like protein